jgi:hypothetical protein
VAEYLIPLLLVAVLFVGFGLLHGNGKSGGCSGCTGCSDSSECKNERDDPNAAAER